MNLRPTWNWPSGNSLHYCFKAALAALVGYALSYGDAWNAMYSAFSAALVVGTSRGEDTGSAANRMRGSVAGIIVGVSCALLHLPPFAAVSLGIGATAWLCTGWGWGIPAARIGATLCAATVLAHSGDAIDYTLHRAANTLIGIACGLAVSYFVLPVRGRDALAASASKALKASSKLLARLAEPQRRLVGEEALAVVTAIHDLDKVLTDARKEFGGEEERLRRIARGVAVGCLGTVAAALAITELQREGSDEQLQSLKLRAQALAERAAREPAWSAVLPGAAHAQTQVQKEQAAELALHGLELGLRNVERTLDALGL